MRIQRASFMAIATVGAYVAVGAEPTVPAQEGERWRMVVSAEQVAAGDTLLRERLLEQANAVEARNAEFLVDAATAWLRSRFSHDYDVIADFWTQHGLAPEEGFHSRYYDKLGARAMGIEYREDDPAATLRGIWQLPIIRGERFVAFDEDKVLFALGRAAHVLPHHWASWSGPSSSVNSMWSDPGYTCWHYLRGVYEMLERDTREVANVAVMLYNENGSRFVVMQQFFYCQTAEQWRPWGVITAAENGQNFLLY